MNKQGYTQWTALLTEMAKCVVAGDMDMAQSYKIKADHIFESAKKEYDFFKKDLNNFGLANHIIENKVSRMMSEGNEKPIAEYIKLIREDKNLRSQYTFYKAMQNYTSSAPAKEYVKESLEDVKKTINEDTIQRSNAKLIDFMKKHHITKNVDMISEDKRNYFDACQFILEHKKNSTVLADMYDNIESVANFIERNPRQIKESTNSRKTLVNTINDFNKRYAMLEGESKELFSILLEKVEDDDTPEVKDEKTGKKMKLLNDMKTDCLSKIEELAQDASEEDQAKIEEMKELVNSMVYEESTIVSNIAKLIEVKEALSV